MLTYEEEHYLFHYTIGSAIGQWAELEKTLCRLCFPVFSIPFDPLHTFRMHQAFFSIDSFRSKLKFSDNFLINKLKEAEELEEWGKLNGRLAKLSSSRNHLAHYSTMIYPEASSGRKIALIPWIQEEKKTPKKKTKKALPPPGALCIRDIHIIRYEFFHANVDLINFSGSVNKAPGMLQVPIALHGGPPTIRQIRDQMHEALGHPPKPSRQKS